MSDREDLSVQVTERFNHLPIGRGDHDRWVSASGSGPDLVTSRHDGDALVWGADLVGLAKAVAETVGSPVLVAVADGSHDVAGRTEPVSFPAPVGVVDAQLVGRTDSGTKVVRSSGRDEWSAIRVTGDRTLALVDDGRFAAAVVLAAAASLPEGPVWAHHEEFLVEVTRLGLRFAQAVV